ncbi:hypothetical protein Zm00014a_042348 [Zea mays]|uniref:Uncharacterized protein n=1 Tax=Zea mays TaxID=4577 RepID=A0A3L6E7D4_MAIZE|nr:hypothetical protein Zm00014a_042348 [Zea mays]
MAPLSLLPPTWSFPWSPLLSPLPWQPSPAMAEFPRSTLTPYSPPWTALELHSSLGAFPLCSSSRDARPRSHMDLPVSRPRRARCNAAVSSSSDALRCVALARSGYPPSTCAAPACRRRNPW